MDDSVWVLVNPSQLDSITNWINNLKLNHAIGPLQENIETGKQFHIVRVTSEDYKLLTMACLFGRPIIFFDSKEINKT